MKVNLKEIDYKQFLLERGEQVGLGVALTLMVLMLIFNLFMPSKGFFSGSPESKSKPLADAAKSLENALQSSKPAEKDLPPEGKQGLIALDTTPLQPKFYQTEPWYEPGIRENPERRPPKIYNVKETYALVERVPIDTYLFNSAFTKITVLRDPEGKNPAAGSAGGRGNPFSMLQNRGGGGGPMPPPMGGNQRGGQLNSLQKSQGQFRGNLKDNFSGVGSEKEYKAVQIDLDKYSPQDMLARQLRPARMAIIAGSFPYKQQVEEFRRKLHMSSIDEVFNDFVEDDKEGKASAFRFLGAQVQRREVDAAGKPLEDWKNLLIKENYEIWLAHSFLPYEPEDPKILPVRFNGLVWPYLRAFHAGNPDAPTRGLPMFPGPGGPGGPMQLNPKTRGGAAPEEEVKSSYPDITKGLPKLKETLAKLQGTEPKKVAAPPDKFKKPKFFDSFNPDAAPPADPNDAAMNSASAEPTSFQGLTIPEYCLMRVVDLDITPGKSYRYRVRIKMGNPNYNRADVASPEYKMKRELESDSWVEVDQTVQVPPELNYYVVDQTKVSDYKADMPPLESARYQPWRAAPPANSIAFQFHRWVESTPIDRKEADPVPVGDWAVAERVFVARGECLGRKVKVDLPVWQYTHNAFVLPTDELNVKRKNRGRVPTGFEVDFSEDNPDRETILVDFEGGTSHYDKKISDSARMEVLMLSPEGKLMARNSVDDANNGQRIDRREKVLKRIEDIRSGKTME